MADAPKHPVPGVEPLPDDLERRAWLAIRIALIIGLVFFGLLRLVNLTCDYPPHLSWDGDAYTDEGLYTHDAVNRITDGSFYIPLDFNQFVALPLMPMIKAAFFAVFGVSLVTARMVSIVFVLGAAIALYFTVRRFEDRWTSLLAVLILAANNIVFAFSRLAIDEIPLVFWVTLSLAFAVRVRGEKWWLYSMLLGGAFACAIMTKTSAIFAAPLLVGVVLLQENDLKRNVMKCLLSAGVFLVLIGIWVLMLVIPYYEDFRYFYDLNVAIGRSETLVRWLDRFRSAVLLSLNGDPILPVGLLLIAPALLVLCPKFRRHPLLFVAFAWFILYMAMFATYGRYYPRFIAMTIPPLAIWAAISVRHALDLKGGSRFVAYALVILVGWSTLWQFPRVVGLVAAQGDTFNEMAADILERVESDPRGNRVIMGHVASGVALRTGLIARNDRYSPHPMDERLDAFEPGWAISEGEFRIFPQDRYYHHAEYYDLTYDIELVASYDTLENFRGYKMHLYRLSRREDVPMPPPFARATLEGEHDITPIQPRDDWPAQEGRIELLGHDWNSVSELSPFGERYIHRGAVLDGRMFISGGYNDKRMFMGDVWSSEDGASWRLEIGEAPWSARMAHGMVENEGQLYIMGGYSGTLLNDVWRSSNGADWRLVTSFAPWEPRSHFQVVSHEGWLFLIGGHGNGERYSDVWKSRDGFIWELVAEDAWPRRSHHAAASHDGRIFLTGGADFDFEAHRHRYHRDIWSSTDGRDWTLVHDDAPFRGRVLMHLVSLGPTLFAIGGDDLEDLAAMRRDTWVSADGVGWWRLVRTDKLGTRPRIEYDLRINHVVLGAGDSLYVIGGHQYDAGRKRATGRYRGMWRNDNVWRSSGAHLFREAP